MSVKFQVLSLLPVFTSLVSWSLASVTCSKGHYLNGTGTVHESCSPCSGCPLGYGVRTPCEAERDTECQPCTPGYDYSNTTGMEPCTLCDVNSNCPWGKSKIAKNCTITSPAVCLGCADGSFFHPDIGPNGACLEWPRFPPPSTSDQKTVNMAHSNFSESLVGVFEVTVITVATLAVCLLALVCFYSYNTSWNKKRGETCALAKDVEGQTTATFRSSYSEPAPRSSRKVMASSPKFQEESVFFQGHKEPRNTMHVAAESNPERKSKGGIEMTDFATSKNNLSASADISRKTRNISNLPKNVDPEMAARRLVDNNGGKLTSDGTEVSLTKPSANQNFDVLPLLKEPSRLVDHNEGKLTSHDTEVSLTKPSANQNFDVLSPLKEPSKTMIDAEAESVFERSREWEHEEIRSTGSNNSAASDVSQVIWNISNLPVNADPKMVACGFVDHKGGKLTIGDTGVSLTIPPHAIPEGRTEGIFIAIMNQEKEHPKVTSKEPLLSPVVECGPNGLKFDRHVILSMPHCALLGEGSCKLKVQYNESEPGKPADWKELIDVSKQDGSEPHLAIAERNVVHIVVDHFTGFAVTGGQPGSTKQAMKPVKIVAYVTPPEADGDCAVRVYCVSDTPAHLEAVHNQEVDKLGGKAKDIKPFDLMEGGSDVLVQVTNFHPGWTTTLGDKKIIDFQHIWEGIERMPYCTFLFSLACKDVSHFRAAFVIKQVDCQDDKHKQEIIVSTPVKHSRDRLSEISMSDSNHNNLMPEQNCTFTASESSAALLNAGLFGNPSKSTFQANVLLGACADGHTAFPIQPSRQTSGYFSSGFEPLAFTNLLSPTLCNELVKLLDPPHPRANWKNLAEDLGFEMKDIRWLEHQVQTSPTFVLLTVVEKREYSLYKLAETLHKEGRDDAAKIIEDQLEEKETSV